MASSYLVCASILLSFFSAISLAPAEANSPLSFKFETLDSRPSFNFYGDAKISNSTINSSNGRIMYKKPITFLGRSPSFSTDFAFSLTRPNGEEETLAFLMSPHSGSAAVISIEFGSKVRIDVGGEISLKSGNISSLDWVLSDGRMLHSWIDYNGFLKRLEVRLGMPRPSTAMISYPVDLSDLLRKEAMLVGLRCSNRNLTRFSSIYSWRFVGKNGALYHLHSEPLDPSLFVVRSDEVSGGENHSGRVGRDYYPLRVMMVWVLGAAFGALVGLVVFVLRSEMVKHYPVAPGNYEKIGLGGNKVEVASAK